MNLLSWNVCRQAVAVCLLGVLAVPAGAQQATPQSQQNQTASKPQAEPASNQTPMEGRPSSAPTQVPVPGPQVNRLSGPFQFSDFAKPRGHFPNPIGPYLPRSVAEPNLANTPRIEQLMVNGKLMLSLNDAISLALENNLDIAIARYNLPIADTDIMLANAGQATRGVNTGVVQGTPGGGVLGLGGTTTTTGSQGGGAGGTTAGAGGAGTGSSGLVTSTLGVGSLIPSFDPIIQGTLQLDRNNTQGTSAFAGVPISNTNTSTVDLQYTQGFHWGTQVNVVFDNTRVTTNQPFSTLSPTLNSNYLATVTQPLLQGLGFLPNTRFIRIAKNNREISDVAFRLQVITSVDQIENIYWDLVSAYENVKVQNDALALAQKTLQDNQKQVQIGTLAPIEVVRAQSVVATNQQSLIVAQTNLQLQQLLMKNALSRTLVDPVLAEAEVVPTSVSVIPPDEPIMPVQDLINDGLSHRAELAESRIDLTNRDITNRSTRNALLPQVNLFGYYGGSGVGGQVNPNATLCTPTTTGFCIDPSSIPPRFAGGPVSIGNTLQQTVSSTAPDKGVGLQLLIPLRNRTGQADQVRAELEYRQAQMRLQQLENQVRIEVRNAQFSVQQNRAAVEASQAAVALAQQSLDAEQKKYALGASTSTLVLQQQSGLTQAQSNLVGAKAAYEKSRVELDRATGLTLTHNGILLSDAVNGQVTHQPDVPYVAPRPLDETGRPSITPQSEQKNAQPPQPEQQQQPQQPQQPPAQPPQR
ncbi:MAG: TolC family protein [Acidobacteriales bacterium]|nr:TolC family protein [Terriglobales bacterium]